LVTSEATLNANGKVCPPLKQSESRTFSCGQTSQAIFYFLV